MEKREKTFEDRLYIILTPPVLKAMPLCTKVMVLLGPVIGSLGKDVKKGGWDAFSQAVSIMDADTVQNLMISAVKMSQLTFDGVLLTDDLNFERHFGQYRQDLYQVCLWCLWESVKDFLPIQGLSTLKDLEKKLNKSKEGFGNQMKTETTSSSQKDGQ